MHDNDSYNDNIMVVITCDNVFKPAEDECSGDNVTHFFMNNLCHVAVSGSFTWFQAQNECHHRNFSVASFININLNSTLISTQLNQSEYWIAITRSLWFWADSGVLIVLLLLLFSLFIYLFVVV